MILQFLEFGREYLKNKHRICPTHWSVMSDLLPLATESSWFVTVRIKSKLIWWTYTNQQHFTHYCPLGWVVLYKEWEFFTAFEHAVSISCQTPADYSSFVSSGRSAGLLRKRRASSKVGIIKLCVWNMHEIFVKIYACPVGCIFIIASWLKQIYVDHCISWFLLTVQECGCCDFRQKWLLQSLYSFSPHGPYKANSSPSWGCYLDPVHFSD